MKEGQTKVLGTVAVAGTIAAVALEYVYVWRRGSAPLVTEVEGAEEVLVAGAEAAVETLEVAVEGYRTGSVRENSLLNLLVAFSGTLGITRLSTHLIRAHGSIGPFHNLRVGERHIHHFVPGIAVAFASGTVAILSRDERLDPWLALPFGAGVALTLDESALLLELDDVYWTERGLVSVQIALAAMALMATAAVTVRLLARGAREVLGPVEESAPPTG
jgi:hypothetical protein